MARYFLMIYVFINICIIVFNIFVNIWNDKTVHYLSSDDWIIFMIGCGALAICEVLDKK